MQSSSERLENLAKQLLFYNMAAASSFYSVVAGVGAGTGMEPANFPRSVLLC